MPELEIISTHWPLSPEVISEIERFQAEIYNEPVVIEDSEYITFMKEEVWVI